MFRFRILLPKSLPNQKASSIVVEAIPLSRILDPLRIFHRGKRYDSLGAVGGIFSIGLGFARLKSTRYYERSYYYPIDSTILFTSSITIFIGSSYLILRGQRRMKLASSFLRQYRPIGVSESRRVILSSSLYFSPFPDIQKVALALTAHDNPYGLLARREDLNSKSSDSQDSDCRSNNSHNNDLCGSEKYEELPTIEPHPDLFSDDVEARWPPKKELHNIFL